MPLVIDNGGDMGDVAAVIVGCGLNVAAGGIGVSVEGRCWVVTDDGVSEGLGKRAVTGTDALTSVGVGTLTSVGAGTLTSVGTILVVW